ncbi:MAG TPA: hypothetical protein HA349_07820 [Methanotrichaceae archaeon]|nr:hypothetical protein [Methanotrichaceae archaeon]
MAEELIKIEENYRDPPHTTDEQKAVEGLRGGAAVLIVAAWERFLRRLIEEELTNLTKHTPKVPFKDLPPDMQTYNVIKTLERATKGPNKKERLAEIKQACESVIYDTVDPVLFIDTKNNPKPKVVTDMFKNLGIPNIFIRIKGDFERKSEKKIPDRFIEQKLEAIINRRHVVAHKADALRISRLDLDESIKFMNILAQVFEKYLQRHMKNIIKKHIK